MVVGLLLVLLLVLKKLKKIYIYISYLILKIN